MKKSALEDLAGDLASGNHIASSFADSVVAGFNRYFGLGFFAAGVLSSICLASIFFRSVVLSSVQYDHHQTFGFNFSGSRGRKISFHYLISIVGSEGKTQDGRLVAKYSPGRIRRSVASYLVRRAVNIADARLLLIDRE